MNEDEVREKPKPKAKPKERKSILGHLSDLEKRNRLLSKRPQRGHRKALRRR